MTDDTPRIRRRTVLKTAGAVAATLASGGVAAAADCDGPTFTTTTGGHLSVLGGDCHYVTYDGGTPCYIDLRLTSDATDADFDLFANLSSSCPSRLFHDYAADTPDEDARLTIYDPDPSTSDVSVLVSAESGSGDYTLEIETRFE